MPPRVSHRVDLLIVPRAVEHLPDAAGFEALRAQWSAEGRLTDAGRSSLVLGGFRRLWLDLPEGQGVTLYMNHQGGARVSCPCTGASLAREFGRAVEAWRRQQGPRALACPACAQVHALEEVRLAPPGAFARGAVVFTDVAGLELAPGVREALEAAVVGEGSREVVRRVG